jgi:hypothetical protein
LEYFQALFKKIEEKILGSPELKENIVLDKLIGIKELVQVLPCDKCAKKDN